MTIIFRIRGIRNQGLRGVLHEFRFASTLSNNCNYFPQLGHIAYPSRVDMDVLQPLPIHPWFTEQKIFLVQEQTDLLMNDHSNFRTIFSAPKTWIVGIFGISRNSLILGYKTGARVRMGSQHLLLRRD